MHCGITTGFVTPLKRAVGKMNLYSKTLHFAP